MSSNYTFKKYGLFVVVIFLFSLFPGPVEGYDRMTGKMFASRSEVISPHGMAASSHPLVSQIGIDILKRGGTAVDAAIAMNAALGLMEPTGSGIGGDLFAIVWDNGEKKLYGLNSSGPAPAALNLKVFKDKGLKQVPYHGMLPVTIPGAVDGWFELHKKFGKLPMKDVLAPAIEYAENGFPMTELIGYYWKRSVQIFKDYPNFQKTYAPWGKAPAKGEIFKNPDLARTYSIIAVKGRDAFYKGELAEKIADYCRKNDGYISMADLAAYHAEWVEPVSINYKGFDVWELPPNGQGIAALQMLQILKNYNLKAMGHNSAQYLHHLVEAKKIAYEDRARFYADMRFNDIPVKRLISDEYAQERAKLLNPVRASRKLPNGASILEHGDTVYLTVVDKDRNAVSLIQSNYAGFGSGMVPDGLGFCLQDRGALFSLEEGHPNVIEPGKRPFHTIIPAFVTKDNKPVFSFGVMGGSMQPQGHVQVLLNIIEFGMNIQEAGDAPRFRHGGSSQPNGGIMTDGGTLYLESGIGAEVIRSLLGMGHNVSKTRGGFGGYQGIWIDHINKVLIGATESRKDGCALGY